MKTPPVHRDMPQVQDFDGVKDYAPGIVRVSLGRAKRIHKRLKRQTTRHSVEKFFNDNFPMLKVTDVRTDQFYRFLVTIEKR